jgi:ABC-type transport system involved in multi-copper enzyme maturation permease subunit
MIGLTLAIARNTFIESIRQSVFFVIVMLSGLLQLLSTWGTGFSMDRTTTAEVSADNKLLFDIGLATVFVCGMLLAAFVATAAISREIENKTILTVVSKPIGRPIVVIGKYLGIVAAILVAVVIMLAFLLLGIRHGVMMTASDTVDVPVVLFAFLAVGLSLLLAAWCNFFYGWVFPQTAMLIMLPAIVLAYFGVLVISKNWHFQSPMTEFKPQITIACYCLTLAILVLSAVACAASTRLGQVMTITVCAGVFLLGLLSNHLLGRHAFDNEFAAAIKSAEPANPQMESFTRAGDTYTILLDGPPTLQIRPGTSFYYGGNPNGFRLAVPPFPPFEADLNDSHSYLGEDATPAVVVTQAEGTTLTVRNLGGRPVPVSRPPQTGDYIFLHPTQTNWPVLTAWSVIPNVQQFWLIDAVSQNRPVPPQHIAMVTAYALAQIGVFLSLGILLFQEREVG